MLTRSIAAESRRLRCMLVQPCEATAHHAAARRAPAGDEGGGSGRSVERIAARPTLKAFLVTTDSFTPAARACPSSSARRAAGTRK
jgi:hypothetical protein